MKRILLPIAILAATADLSTAQDQVDFEKHIWPIFEAKCVDCHQAPYEKDGKLQKPKAGLRLDGAWAISLGSENGAVMTPGNAEESELWWRTDLEEDDDDFMPPQGKADPLTATEKALFKKWIDQGADFGGWAGNLEGKPKELSNAGDKLPVSEIQEAYKKLSEGISPLKESAWKSVTEAGGRVMPLAEESPLLSVDFRLAGEEADDAKVGTVGAISENVAQLDASKTAITDEALAQVAEMKRLVRLDLHQTKVGDAGIKHLKGLENLRYLNLYGTEVTDAGLEQLKGLKTLDSIYLWQSKVTDKGAKQLQKALPDAKINWK